MKFGFSTLVCPGWTWADILTAASDLGFDGIELRGIEKAIYLPRIKMFTEEHLPAVVHSLDRLQITIPCLTTGAFLFDPSLSEAAQTEVKEYIQLAPKLRAPYIRVLADRDPAPGIVDEQEVAANLRMLLPLAEQNHVTLLVETNGVYADSAKLKELCETINHPSLGVLWDVHHPFRFFGETPEQTYQNLAPWIRHVHVKDSVMNHEKVEYRMMGYGDVPVQKALDLLAQGGYDAFVVLEWVKRWNMSLEEPGIVLPHFLSTMKTYVE